MTYRISDLQMTSTFIDEMMQSKEALEQKRQEIATGYRVLNPSDDPGQAGTIASLQHALQRIDGHEKRISLATSSLQTQETIVTSADDLLTRAKELATQAANGPMSGTNRTEIADEVFALRDELARLANTRAQGSNIYGGKDDSNPPFTLNNAAPFFYTNPPDASPAANPSEKTHWAFSSSPDATETRSVMVTDTDSVRVTSRADQVFEPAINALEELGRALKGYSTGLTGGVPDGSGTAYTDTATQTQDIEHAIDAIDDAKVNHLDVELSSIGARTNQLDQTNSILESLKTTTEEARSSLQDTDMISAASEFTNLQTALQGLLAAGSRINNLSLLNYL